jgi:AcrR family transcriptional regulator
MPEQTDESVTTSPLGRRRPRRRSQRQIEESAEIKAAIVRTALPVFAERGYTQTTLEAVATLCGLTRSGILHHFSSKEALFRAVLELQMSWAQHQAKGASDPAVRGLAAFVGGTAEARVPLQLVHVLEGEAIAGNESAAEHVRARAHFVELEVRRRLEAGRERGEIDPKIDLAAATTLIAAAVNGLQTAWLLDDGTPTEAAFDLLLRLLAPHP